MEVAAEVQKDLVTVKHGDDSGLLVRFYFNKVEEAHFIKINVPGDNKTEWDRKATEHDKERFNKQWRLYEEKLSQFGEDDLITDLEFLNDSQIQELKAGNVHTVKQLSGLTDSAMNNLGLGMREIVKKAQNWLMNQESDAKEKKLLLEIRKRDDHIAEQDNSINDLKAQMDQLFTQLNIAKGEQRDERVGQVPPEAVQSLEEHGAQIDETTEAPQRPSLAV